jgi:hypothetical protein
MSIPKIIHYCWLSGDPIPPDYKRCMDSWKPMLPGYDFLLWDTKRFDINSTTWTRQAFETQLYACVCDYIRLYAVYHYGGIYLDMDMEVVKPFGDLLQKDLILAYENHISENIEAGCFGAGKGHPYIRACMEYLENRNFCDPKMIPGLLRLDKTIRHDFINPPISPEIMKTVLQESFSSENYPILTPDYFTAKNVVTGKIEATPNTITIHHFATNYHSEEWRATRAWEQKIKSSFGENNILSKILCGFGGVKRRIKETSVKNATRYYVSKYIKKIELPQKLD